MKNIYSLAAGPPRKNSVITNTIFASLISRFFGENNEKKSKFWSESEIFVKNQTFCTKSKFLYKIKIFVQNQNFCTKSKLLYKIKIFVQNRNFRQKFKFSSKIKFFLMKN